VDHKSSVILAYQGVSKRETNESPLAIARQIAAEGITEGQIRDEVPSPPPLESSPAFRLIFLSFQLFCQLCKQTCYTPNEYHFPPFCFIRACVRVAACCVLRVACAVCRVADQPSIWKNV
jgi:hypothetical protein